jgi:DNA end-binding protein Ku
VGALPFEWNESCTADGMAQRQHAKKEVESEEESESGSRSASRGARRGIWSGSISFGLLQIPVTLYAAESRAEELHFRLLDKRDLSPVRYERVSSSTGKKVEWKDIVKGYEVDKDEFVVMDPEDFAKANVQKTQTIDIQDFVPRDAIDPAYFETPYFVVPQKRAAKAYTLLREALAKKQAVAIATFVLRTREHLVALMPQDDAIMLEILRFGHELKEADDLPLPSASEAKAVSEREVAMAEQLIDGMMVEWEPKRYKDRYYRDVMKIIDEKSKTGATTEHHTRSKGVVAHDVVDLLDLLKKSVAKSGHANDDRPGLKKAGARTSTAKRTRTKKRGRAA